MANKRKKGKKLYGFWITDHEHEVMQEAAKRCGFENVSDYLKWAAIEQIAINEKRRELDDLGVRGSSELCQ